jgi:hypothetical protein
VARALLEDRPLQVPRAREVSHEPPGEAVARPGGIPHVGDGVGRQRDLRRPG